MTKLLVFLFVLLSIAPSCKNNKASEPANDYSGFTEKEITLAGITQKSDDPDTIGKLYIKTAPRLDTFYQWLNNSDCRSCGTYQYRFSDSRYDQFAESGWFWTSTPDSVYQFTISHEPFWPGPDSSTLKQLVLKDTQLYNPPLYQFTGPGQALQVKKEFREINGRGFIISRFMIPHGVMTNDTTLYLTAITHLKKRVLNIVAECGARDTLSFLENMYKSLLSVRIEEK